MEGKKTLPLWQGALIVLGLALFTRLFLLFVWQPVISRDSVIYIQIGEHLWQGEWKKGLLGEYPPGYPALIALFLSLGCSGETAAQLASLSLGVVLPLFVFGVYQSLGSGWATLSGALVACQPYLMRYSVEAISEMTFLFFLALGIFCFFFSLEKKQWGWLFPASFAALLAYLVRPEGILLWLFLFGFCLVKERKILAFFALFLPFFLALLPYLFFLNQGKLSLKKIRLTQKSGIYKALEGVFVKRGKQGGVEWTFQPSGLGRLLKRVGYNGLKNLGYLIEITHPLLFLFALLALGKVLPPYSTFRTFLWFFALAQFFLVSLVRPSSRLTLQVAFTLSFIAPLGVFWLSHWEWMKGKWGYLVGLFFLTALPIGLRPMDRETQALRRAGKWLRKHAGEGVKLVSHDIRVAFYGKARYVYLGFRKRFASEKEREKYWRSCFRVAESYRARWLALRSFGMPSLKVPLWERVKTFGQGSRWEISLWFRKKGY